MLRTNSCPCCTAQGLIKANTILAPFIKDIAAIGESEPGELLECQNCHLRFFADRYTDDECRLIYQNYRNDEYFIKRHHHERWYTRKINDEIGHDEKEISSRKEAIHSILKSHSIPVSGSILDWGGDRGQFIPDDCSEKFLFDISDAPAVKGVIRLHSEAEVLSRSYDLVMNCHVLEHCSSPASVAEKIAAIRSRWFYFEVPYEPLVFLKMHTSTLYKSYVRHVGNSRLLWLPIDFLTTAFRVKFGIMLPFGVIKQHEHINYFDERSLPMLLSSLGLTPVYTAVITTNSTSMIMKAVACLASKP